jgi:hypothetical protein
MSIDGIGWLHARQGCGSSDVDLVHFTKVLDFNTQLGICGAI